MKDMLIRCFYDGMTVAQAVSFIERSYGKNVGQKTIKSVQDTIFSQAGKKWN